MPAGSNSPQLFVGLGTPDGQIMSDDSADALKFIESGASGGRVAISDITFQSSQAITSSGVTNGSSFVNPGARGALFYLNVSSYTGSGGQSATLDITVQAKDPVSGTFFNLPGAAFTQVTTSTNAQTLVVHPAIPNDSGTGFRRRPGPLLRVLRWQATAQALDSGGGQPGSYEFTIGGTYIP